MDNNPLTPRASSFSIASLITSDYCDDENSLYHSMTNPIPSNFYSNHSSIDQISNDNYSNLIQPDLSNFNSPTLSETNNGQYQQQVRKRKHRSTNCKQIKNLEKPSSATRRMEGLLDLKRSDKITNQIRFILDYIQLATENIQSTTNMNKLDNENLSNGNDEAKKPLHPKLVNVKMVLESKSLWDEFDKLGTEMIVTRSGR